MEENKTKLTLHEPKNDEETLNTRKSLDELNKDYQAELEEYKKTLSGITDAEELQKEEQKWIDKLNEFDAYIKDREYSLPASVDYNGKTFTRSEVFGIIKTFINEKCEIEWKYAPKMVEFTKWFIGNRTKISYPYLDSVLRLLDQFKYRGVKEWENILTINEYFKQCTADYQYDGAELYHLSLMHNAVMEQMQLNEPVNTEAPSKEDIGNTAE
jgi:hypothetical protein